MTVRSLQKLLNALFAHYDLPIRVTADGQLGPATRAAIKYAKLALGYAPSHATGKRTAGFYLALRRKRTLIPAQNRRGLAWRKSYRAGGSSSILAQQIINSPNADFSFWSPTGGTAKVGLSEVAHGGKARVAWTGEHVEISKNLLAALAELVNSHHVQINCVVNGHHRDGSTHYDGLAADIGKGSGVTTSQLQAICAKHDVNVLNEDAYHWHIYVGGTA